MQKEGIKKGFVFQLLQHIPLQSIIKLIYNIDTETNELKDDIKKLAEVHGNLMNWVFKSYDVRLPFYHLLPTKKNKIIKEYLTLWRQFNKKLIEIVFIHLTRLESFEISLNGKVEFDTDAPFTTPHAEIEFKSVE